MRWTVGAKIATGFALALTILCVIGAVSYHGTARLTEASNWVTHTHKVLERLGKVIQALTDAETGQRGYIITAQEPYLEPFRTGLAVLDQNVKEIRELTRDNPRQQQRLDALEPLLKERQDSLNRGIEIQKTKGANAVREWVIGGSGKTEMDRIRRAIAEMENEENMLLAKRSDEAQTTVQYTNKIIVGGTLCAFVILCVAGFWITRNISKPLRTITATAERMAAGDLSVKVIANSRRDEVGVMARAFGLMIENLRSVTTEIAEASNVLATSATQIVASSTELAAGSAQTATAVAETTTTVEEVRQTAQVATEKSKYVSESAQSAAVISQSGRKNTEETRQGMGRIREQMDSIAQSMVRLSEQTQAIGQIITTVDDLAQQSNLLAVNASIEAVKAGEQGKGFTVVAQEVKSLAEQSKAATMQVRTILNDIQKATGAAAMATEQGSKAVEAGESQSNQAGESILALANSVTEAAQAATQIAASSQQQLVGVDQVALAMESIKQASSQNVDSAKQLEDAARNLDGLGKRLRELTGRFQLQEVQPA